MGNRSCLAQAVAAEPQWLVFGWRAGGRPIDRFCELGGKSVRLIGIAFFEPAFLLGNGLHARFTAALASMENRDRSCAGAAGRGYVRTHRHHVHRAGAIADAAHRHPVRRRPWSIRWCRPSAALTNLGSNFLERLGNQRATASTACSGPTRAAAAPPRARKRRATGPGSKATGIGEERRVGVFVGDNRKTWGGVAGIGARVAPGINIGFSVDQSRTAIDVPLALQSATIDLTQLGFNASVDSGPWTWASAVVHGFGNINSRRDTGASALRPPATTRGSTAC